MQSCTVMRQGELQCKEEKRCLGSQSSNKSHSNTRSLLCETPMNKSWKVRTLTVLISLLYMSQVRVILLSLGNMLCSCAAALISQF